MIVNGIFIVFLTEFSEGDQILIILVVAAALWIIDNEFDSKKQFGNKNCWQTIIANDLINILSNHIFIDSNEWLMSFPLSCIMIKYFFSQ